jgi:hypothetical protein
MPSTQLTDFTALAVAFRQNHLGGSIKVAPASKSATFSSPRLAPSRMDSTLRHDVYHSTIHIQKSEVTSITTPAAWIGVLIELPEGASWRSYLAIPASIKDDRLASEWTLEIESQ